MRVILLFVLVAGVLKGSDYYWVYVETGHPPMKRSENGVIAIDGRLYVAGGRGMRPVDVFDPVNNRWDTLAGAPIELHHFQALEYKNELWVGGALTGDYPHETPVENFFVLNTQEGWRKGAEIPADRRRGSTGLVAYKNKIYMVCGIIDGHYDGNVTWFDEYDPATNQWRQLPDAPHARDHFHAAVVDNKLYVMGGRATNAKSNRVLENVVPEVDVFDFKSGTWATLPAESNLPTPRAGCTAVVQGKSILVIGGETVQLRAHAQCESFDIKTSQWTSLDTLNTGRHGTQATVLNGSVYIVAGSANRGGGPEQDSMECCKKAE